jgi:uncharacterized UBP type Zn finger protein
MERMDVWALPQVLVIHTRRFEVNEYGIPTHKNRRHVDFPLVLDEQHFRQDDDREGTASDGQYRLFAVSNHVGRLNEGHYTAHARHPATGKWYYFNDSVVTEVQNPKDVITSNAYVLFYERVADSSSEDEDEYEGSADMSGGGDSGHSRSVHWRVRKQTLRAPQHWPHNEGAASARS